jgi:flagellar hook protein FlgE
MDKTDCLTSRLNKKQKANETKTKHTNETTSADNMAENRNWPTYSFESVPQRSNLSLYLIKHHASQGRAIAQAVSRWLLTAAARVQTRVWSSGICGGQSGAGAGFLRVFRFPLLNHHNHPGQVQ